MKNILMIAIDTLSARHMSCYGYERNTTPFIDNFASQSVLFEKKYCQSIPTEPSFASTYTGQYSITNGIVSHGGGRELKTDAPLLPQILKEHEYTTCAIDNLYNINSRFAKGYEYYINPRLNGEYAQASPCSQYNLRAIPWLNSHKDEKFFMFVHYWDPHTYYIPPVEYRELFYKGNPCDKNNRTLDGLWKHPFGEPWKLWFDQLMPGITDAEYIAAMYDSEIRYVDDGVKELLQTIDKLGLTDDTLVIIFSDHGEMMYKHGIYFDHHGLYDEDIHVPLIIRYPGLAKAGLRIPHLVQHIDIAPTVLNIAGFDVPDSMEGRSLVPYITGKLDEEIYPFQVSLECTRMMKWAIRTDSYKFILAREQDYRNGPMKELYDLKLDPDELNNIVEKRPDIAKELEDKLEGWISMMMKKNNLTVDPLVESGLSLATEWFEWVKEHQYW